MNHYKGEKVCAFTEWNSAKLEDNVGVIPLSGNIVKEIKPHYRNKKGKPYNSSA